jgi:hypothetical protein
MDLPMMLKWVALFWLGCFGVFVELSARAEEMDVEDEG